MAPACSIGRLSCRIHRDIMHLPPGGVRRMTDVTSDEAVCPVFIYARAIGGELSV